MFLASINKLIRGSKLQVLKWDLATITAGDFTVEFDIQQDSYYRWFTEYYNKANGDFVNGVSPGISLKRYLTSEIESRLSNELTEEVRERGIDQVRIANITFAFNNGEMIDKLRKRGTAIADTDYDKMREIEKEIQDDIHENFKDLTEPVTAFLTFEEEKCYQIALEYSKKDPEDKEELMYQEFKFTDATEPTNIIWENRHLTRMDLHKRSFVVFLIIVALLAICFLATFWTQKELIQIQKDFPIKSCSVIKSTYGDDLQTDAAEEYVSYTTDPSYTLTGTLQCFCIDQIFKNGLMTTRDTLYSTSEGEEPIC